ncbi:MAG: ATP-binding protein [Clostridia bacterium]|nr:ATP-binding protein [Clostridia bacterium]
MIEPDKLNAEVISVFPDKVRISVDNLEDFQIAEEKLKVGSYLRIADNDNAVLIAIIENFSIEVGVTSEGSPRRKYILEANPLGLIRDGKFERGGDTIAIPPKKVEPAKKEEIEKIFQESLEENKKFSFATLSTNSSITVPVDGDKFFNKHIAIVGSTGSGKSHSVAKIIQNAINAKSGEYTGLNNSHVVIFDIHSEYKTAFPTSNFIDISSLILPYWLLNSDELQELFIETESNDHNQRNTFKESVINSRILHFKGTAEQKNKIHFDSPLYFDITDVLAYANAKNSETIDTGELYATGEKKGQPKTTQGSLNGKLTNFVSRLENRINDKRLEFLLGDKAKKISFDDTLKQLLGYGSSNSNVTILDLSGVPFEVLSITVSLISRILFEYGYYYKRMRCEANSAERINNDVPLLLVYEEAHKYVPNSDLVKYRASKESIERIAKEGRKYGISLLLASQRPSEISETIFSQCNNFLALRLTNPNDQNYVKRLLPDTLGNLVDKLPSLKAGECLLIGDAVILPSIVQMDRCDPEPASNDIPYFQLWKEEWKALDVLAIKDAWYQK